MEQTNIIKASEIEEESETRDVIIEVAASSSKTHGIKDKTETWWNMKEGLPEEHKKNLISRVDDIRPGDKVKLTCDQGTNYMGVKIVEKGPRSDMVSFQDLLKKANKKFDSMSIETAIVVNGVTGEPVLGSENLLFRAVVRATIGKKQFMATAHGDATKENVGENIKLCLPRMAETRAISRCLRWLLGEDTTEEEMPPVKVTGTIKSDNVTAGNTPENIDATDCIY